MSGDPVTIHNLIDHGHYIQVHTSQLQEAHQDFIRQFFEKHEVDFTECGQQFHVYGASREEGLDIMRQAVGGHFFRLDESNGDS